MIKLTNFIFIVIIFCTLTSSAQNGMNFQGVARNSNGIILASQAIAVRLSILQGASTGNIEFQETKTITTNAQGLFNVIIGDGTATTSLGNYKNINWQQSPKFIRIEMDANAGNNFTILGTTQFQYVAFAHFADGVAADNITGILPLAKGGTGVSSLQDLKAALQISNVNNTSDLLKPISNATQNLFNTKLNSTDTLGLSERINLKMSLNDGLGALTLKANASDVTNSLALKENASNKSSATDLGGISPSDVLFPTQKAVKDYLTANAASGGVADGGITTIKLADLAVTDAKIATGISKSKVGLGNIDNTSDALKPVSTAMQAALDLKANVTDLVHSGDVTGTTSLSIINNAVTTNKIADAAITFNKIQNLSASNKVLGRVSSGAGIVEEISTTGTGNVVRATSPTLVTPSIGDATASRISVGTPVAGSYAALEINSTTKGFLPPRMTKVERSILDGTSIVPTRPDKIPTGTTIYCTDCGAGDLQIYNGTEWTSSSGDAPKSLAPGDFALGGIVGYILTPGDNGYVEGVTKGVIIDIKHIDNYDYRLSLSNAIGYDPGTSGTSTALGMGMENTNKIVAALGNYNGGNYIAKHAYDYIGGNYNDWYIPSLDELRKIRNNEQVISKKLEQGAISSTSPNFFITSSVGDVHGRYWAISFFGNELNSFDYASTPDELFDANTYVPIIMVIRSFVIGANTSSSNATETSSTIKSKLGITTLSGANTGDQVLPTLSSLGAVPNSRVITINGTGLDLSSDRAYTINAGLSLTDLESSNVKAKTFQLTQPTAINSTTTTTLDLSTGNLLELVLTGPTTLAFSNPKIGTYIIKVKQDATGGRTLSFPVMKWSDAAVPSITTSANAIDLITLIYDGTHYYGSCLQNF
jgi:hypothetical protein